MKRFFSVILTTVMFSLSVLPFYTNASFSNTQVDYIYVGYDEFHSKRKSRPKATGGSCLIT